MNTFIKIYDNILKLDDLALTDKLILSLIMSYLENDNIFMLSNTKIASRLNLSISIIEKSINKLKNKKYISCTIGKFDGLNSNRIIKIIDKNLINIKDDYLTNKDIYKSLKYFKETYCKK